jgi:nucleotide-binding universal stress UspA family protein
MYERILVPLDGSKNAEVVLAHVQQLAQCTGSEIILLHVITYPHYDYLLTEAELFASLRESLENEGCKYLGQIASRLVDQFFKVRAEVIGVQGRIADTILDYASQQQVGLIALSIQGKKGPDGWAQGSVADQVVRRANVPVLVVRPPHNE